MYVSINFSALVSEQPLDIFLPIPWETGIYKTPFYIEGNKTQDSQITELWQRTALPHCRQ